MNNTLGLTVTGQHIKITEPIMLVSGTVNIYTAVFSFDAEWDDYVKTAVFRCGGVEKETSLSGNSCQVPWEVLTAGGRLSVGVYGTKESIRFPTIWTERTIRIKYGAGPTEEAKDPSPTLVEQLLTKVGNLDTLKTEDKASLVAAINEIWASGGGGSGGTTNHSKLTNRDADDQHPMSAITGLVKALEGKQPSGDYLTQEIDPTVPAWAKAEEKPSYTASEVGADPFGTAASQVAAHNTGTDAHSDIRLLIQELTTRLNAIADSDDTTLDQLSEIVAYIKSNRNLIESVTSGKVNVSDIIDNLTTNAANKPLSATQGVVLKGLIDAITVPSALSELTDDATHRTVTDEEKEAWNKKSDFSGSYNDLKDKPTVLPNPNALTFTGAVTGSYDGSAAVSVKIPSGGDAEKRVRHIATVSVTAGTTIYSVTVDSNGDPLNLESVYILTEKFWGNNGSYVQVDVNGKVITKAFGQSGSPQALELEKMGELQKLTNIPKPSDVGISFGDYYNGKSAVTSVGFWSTTSTVNTTIEIYGVDA